jgi:hypothetical protein
MLTELLLIELEDFLSISEVMRYNNSRLIKHPHAKYILIILNKSCFNFNRTLLIKYLYNYALCTDCLYGDFSWMFCHQRPFVASDVLLLRMFCATDVRFVSQDFL